MNVRLTKRQLPRCFAKHRHAKGVLMEGDFRVFQGSRLRAKLLVFDTVGSLRRFWSRALGRSDLGPWTQGAVSRLAAEVHSFGRGAGAAYLEFDPRYFCVIGLAARPLRNRPVTIILHEAVHVGFAYAKRVGRLPFDFDGPVDEERVAYPAGYAASEMTRLLREARMIE